jgi:hypothetical protein
LQGELAYIKNRLDRIADKLQVTAVDPPQFQTPTVSPGPRPGGRSDSTVPTQGEQRPAEIAPMPHRPGDTTRPSFPR